jgi:putative tricarboxylic transport membrane protein
VDAVLVGLAESVQPLHLVILAGGVLAGLIVGVIPGIGGLFGLAMLIPLTYHLDPYTAFALLLGMASVTATADTIPAILFGVPGGVGAVATVLDGHAMAKNGEAARAFGAAYTASLIGGIFGAVVLALSIPIMRPLVLLLTTPDFFAICALGLSMVAMLAGSQPLKGLAAAMLGMLLSFIGIEDHAGYNRWTFGQVYFWEGLPLVVVFLGLFGLPELASLFTRGSVQGGSAVPTLSGMARGMRDTLRDWPLVLRCSGIGSLLGAIPGIGVVVIDWIAYGHAARHPGNGPAFGQGNVRGVIGPESANNAKEGGSLIPTIAFGVPGSASMSILLGAFIVQGLVPGPDMLGKNASVTVSMVISIAIANILGAAICLFLTRPLATIAGVPAAILVPVVTTLMVVAAFQTNMSVLDFIVLLGIGLLGMAMNELNWPRSAFALGFVLGPSLERYFFLSYQIWGWNWLEQPVVLTILGIGVVTIWRQSLEWYRQRGRPIALPPVLPDIVFGGAVTILALVVFATALGFPIEAGLFPAITATVLAVAGLIVTLQAVFRARRRSLGAHDVAEAAAPSGEWSAASRVSAEGYASILALCTAQAFLILAAGHLVGSFVFVASALLLFGRRAISTVLIAAGTSLVIAIVFDALASQPWPRPWLQVLFDRLAF